jgi:hypothetical protein
MFRPILGHTLFQNLCLKHTSIEEEIYIRKNSIKSIKILKLYFEVIF